MTKVELGVQYLDNSVLAFNRREMTAEAIARGTEMLLRLWDSKSYHMMPTSPNINPRDGRGDVRETLMVSDHPIPDMMKIYPNMVQL